jgi:cyclic pyranopterin monophosphate synthase
MTDLTHTDAEGRARMVDIGAKAETARTAAAEGTIVMSGEALAAIEHNTLAKGDALSTARIAGIMAAKRTADLIPLCHPIAITDVGVDFEIDTSLPGVRVRGHASTHGRTGVEMEALTAVSAALLTIYDMAKSVDREMTISGIRLTAKSGGKSGDWKRG